MPDSMGTVFWFTGLAGAGKTTLATCVYQLLKQKMQHTVFLDGDVLRTMLDTHDNEYTHEARLKIAYRNAKLCQLLATQGVHVVCATISLFHEVQQWNRLHQPRYQEIFVRAPMVLLQKRDQKGIYSGAHDNIVGIDIAPEFPKNPDIIIDNDGRQQPEIVAAFILDQLETI